jgi:hypothetical protein
MALFHFIPAALLIVGVLPCGAQSPPLQNQSTRATKATPEVQSSPCFMAIAPGSAAPSPALKEKLCSKLKEQEKMAIQRFMVEKNSACYSIRDYRFAVPKDSEVPKLKSYSTCVPAARFEARNAVTPQRQSAGPSTSLRSGRDDNSR